MDRQNVRQGWAIDHVILCFNDVCTHLTFNIYRCCESQLNRSIVLSKLSRGWLHWHCSYKSKYGRAGDMRTLPFSNDCCNILWAGKIGRATNVTKEYNLSNTVVPVVILLIVFRCQLCVWCVYFWTTLWLVLFYMKVTFLFVSLTYYFYHCF